MKILGISCSLRRISNTKILINEALSSAEEAGAKTKLISLIGMNIKPCEGCLKCTKSGKCHIDDDMKDICDSMMEADGIILGSPIFSWSVAGQAKVFMDRTFALKHPYLKLSNKVGGMILVASRTGMMNGASLISLYFQSNHMISADIVTALGRSAGAVKKDQFAMKEAQELGRQMVSLIKKGFGFPEEYDRDFIGYIAQKYPFKSSPFE